MNEKDFVQLLQYYRHDLLNELQIVQGYLGMDKIDKVKDKMNDIIRNYDEERKLMNTKAPNLILWMLAFNNHQENIRLTYRINFENKNLLPIDDQLVEQWNQIIKSIQNYGDKNELYEISIQLDEQTNLSGIVVTCFIICPIESIDQIIRSLKKVDGESPLHVERTENGFSCEFLYSV